MDFVDEFYTDKDLSLLKKLTLVIPTYNRNYYLSRCLWYHAHFPFGEIIVADSSPEEKKVVNRETVRKVREIFGVNVRYLEYEPETEKYGGDIYRKWGDAVQHAEMEYSQICTDKEFVVPTTLCKCIDYLDKNENFVCASGAFCLIQKILNNDYYVVKYAAFMPQKEEAVSNKKMIDYYLSALKRGGEKSLLLSLYRSKIHADIYLTLINSNISDIIFGERYLAYIGHLWGFAKFFPNDNYTIRDVTLLRDKNHRINPKESSARRYNRELDNKRLIKGNKDFCDAITSILISKNICDKKEAEDVCHEKSLRRSEQGIKYNRLKYLFYKYSGITYERLNNITIISKYLAYVRKYILIDRKICDYSIEGQIIVKTLQITKKYYALDETIFTEMLT